MLTHLIFGPNKSKMITRKDTQQVKVKYETKTINATPFKHTLNLCPFLSISNISITLLK